MATLVGGLGASAIGWTALDGFSGSASLRFAACLVGSVVLSVDFALPAWPSPPQAASAKIKQITLISAKDFTQASYDVARRRRYSTASRSITKISVSFGPIAGGEPVSP